jgi:hypothetical protein
MAIKRLRQKINAVFSGTGLKKGFSDADLVKAVKRQISTEDAHRLEKLAKGGGVTVKGVTYTLPLSTMDFALSTRNVLIGRKYQNQVLQNPKAARALALEYRGTKYEKYFKRLFEKSQAMKIGAMAKNIKKIDRQVELREWKQQQRKNKRGGLLIKALEKNK